MATIEEIDIRSDMKVLKRQADEIEQKARNENRSLTDYEARTCMKKYEEIQKLEYRANQVYRAAREAIGAPVLSDEERFGNGGNGIGGFLSEFDRPENDPAVRGIAGQKTYKDLFGHSAGSNGGFRSLSEFLTVLKRNPSDSRLQYAGKNYFNDADSVVISTGKEKRASGMTESNPSDGGFLVPDAYSQEIINVLLQKSLMLSKCRVFPMVTPKLIIPAVASGNHSENVFGGVIVYHTNEGASTTGTKPKIENITLVAEKLSCLCYASDELSEDSPNYNNLITDLLAQAMSWYVEKDFIRGDGSGKALGLISTSTTTGSRVEVSKETNQLADSLVIENIVKMMSRLHPSMWSDAIWLCNPDTLPELYTLSVAVGTGGSWAPALTTVGEQPQLRLSRNCFTEMLLSLKK